MKKVILFISFILATLLFFGCSDGKSVSDEYSDTYIASFRVNSDMPLFRCEVFFADGDRNRTEKIVIRVKIFRLFTCRKTNRLQKSRSVLKT